MSDYEDIMKQLEFTTLLQNYYGDSKTMHKAIESFKKDRDLGKAQQLLSEANMKFNVSWGLLKRIKNAEQ